MCGVCVCGGKGVGEYGRAWWGQWSGRVGTVGSALTRLIEIRGPPPSSAAVLLPWGRPLLAESIASIAAKSSLTCVNSGLEASPSPN